jgi:hypothetical protein
MTHYLPPVYTQECQRLHARVVMPKHGIDIVFFQPGMLAFSYNPILQKAETGGQPGLHREILSEKERERKRKGVGGGGRKRTGGT